MVLGTPLGISPSQALLRSCLQRAGFCPVEGSKILYTICKQVELRERHPPLFLTENYYRTLNFGWALGLKHKKKRNSNLSTQGVSGSLQASCKTNFLFLLTCTPKAPIVCNVGFTQEYSLFWKPSFLGLSDEFVFFFFPWNLPFAGNSNHFWVWYDLGWNWKRKANCPCMGNTAFLDSFI